MSTKIKNKLHTYIDIELCELSDKETSAICVSRDSHSLHTFMEKEQLPHTLSASTQITNE